MVPATAYKGHAIACVTTKEPDGRWRGHVEVRKPFGVPDALLVIAFAAETKSAATFLAETLAVVEAKRRIDGLMNSADS